MTFLNFFTKKQAGMDLLEAYGVYNPPPVKGEGCSFSRKRHNVTKHVIVKTMPIRNSDK